MFESKSTQSGRVLLVLLALLCAGGAIAFYKNETRKAEQRRPAPTSASEESVRARENDRRAAEEREQLQRQAERAQQSDLLASSLKAADGLLARWEDAVRVAETTGRGALSGPVATLQAIKRDAQSLEVPPCLAQGKSELVAGMSLSVDAYLEFMANTAKLGSVVAAQKLEEARPHFERYKADRSMCPNP